MRGISIPHDSVENNLAYCLSWFGLAIWRWPFLNSVVTPPNLTEVYQVLLNLLRQIRGR